MMLTFENCPLRLASWTRVIGPPVLVVRPLRSRVRVEVPARLRAPLRFSRSALMPPVTLRGEPAGVSELLSTVMGPGLATLLVKAMVNGPFPVTETLPAPTLVRPASAAWMLAARVLAVLLQVMFPVAWPLNDRAKVPPVTLLPRVSVCVLDPDSCSVRLPLVLKSAVVPLSVPTLETGSPGLTRPPVTLNGPALPVPPNAAPALTVVVLVACCEPSTSRMPALTRVGPV
jgi:hypothetical protein